MLAIFLETLPFFLLIGLGYGAGRTGFFTQEATSWLTKFVFYFALSAMLFRFAATLPVAEIFDPRFAVAYLSACLAVYLVATFVALASGASWQEAAIEAQCSTIGNTGFLGLPMYVVLLGEAAAGPMLMMLALDLIVFSSLIVIIITVAREGRFSARLFATVGKGLLANPMIVSIAAGLLWSAAGLSMPGPMEDFVAILGAAATPGALFAIGASLAGKSAERFVVAVWLSAAKLLLHPMAVAVSALWIFEIDPYPAGVMIAAAAMPVAGNIFMLAQHYGIAPQRVSAAILVSTTVSILTVTLVVAWVKDMAGIG